jgi:2-amino-4-hydroxy-6-hydroxymethyldihydropteridine diphosphokinase
MTSVVIALGSNLGDRRRYLREAVHRLGAFVRVVRVSPVLETEPVDAPAGSPKFYNMVVVGHTSLPAKALLEALLAIEQAMGRRRRAVNGPRVIDLDLILYGTTLARAPRLTLPHPRYRQREFVLGPLRTLKLPWVDPVTGVSLSA